jgi:flagellar motor protein MotB
MKKILLLMASAIVPLVLVGCVPYQTYETMKAENGRLKTANEDLIAKYNRAIQEILKLKNLEPTVAALRQQKEGLENQNKDLLAKLAAVGSIPAAEADTLPKEFQKDVGGEISLSEEVLFNPGQEKFKGPEAMRLLDFLINLIKAEHPNEIVHISGHTDTDPIQRSHWPDNQYLGYQRAYTVYKYFKEKGIPESQMVLHSFSFNLPRESGTTPEAKKKNRRVSFGLTQSMKV